MCEAVYQAARLGYDNSARQGPGGVRTSTWGEFMGDLGFRDPGFLFRQIGWWRETMRARRISLVIADYAPCALLAARSWGIPCAAIGTGYGLPPSNLKNFPVLLPEYNTKLYDEKIMVDAINQAGEALSVPRIENLPEVYTCDVQLHQSFPMLDPYWSHRTATPVSPVRQLQSEKAPGAGEIFVYFSTTERENPQLMDALTALKAPVRMFMPNIDDTLATKMSASGIIVERAPVTPDNIYRRTKLLLNAGQHGTVSLGVAAGLPQVCFPQHLEQMYTARQIEAAGACICMGQNTPTDEICEAIEAAYHDRAQQERASQLAHEVRPLLAQDAISVISDRLAGL